MPAPAFVAIALGSNLGDRAVNIRSGLLDLGSLPDATITAASQLYETAPVGPIPQGPYLNSVAILSIPLGPRELLAELQSIERSRGRDRAVGQRWGPRTLDLDLLVYNDLVLDEPGLTIPHPRLRERAFVLIPLAEIAPSLEIPASAAGPRTTVASALAALLRSGAITSNACTLYEHQ